MPIQKLACPMLSSLSLMSNAEVESQLAKTHGTLRCKINQFYTVVCRLAKFFKRCNTVFLKNQEINHVIIFDWKKSSSR